MILNRAKMGEESFQRQFLDALDHLEFACKLYEIQIRQGGWFLHEHPAAATSWSQECMERILGLGYRR